MDQKSWLWKKRSSEKTLVADKTNNSISINEEVTEVQELLTEKSELERDLVISNEKLSTALSDCNAKDSIAQKQVKIAQEAIAGWEKAEVETISLKKELDKVLQQKAASEERLGHLDAALKECMQQLRFVREEQERRVHGAVVKTSEEFERTRIALVEKLAEASKRLARLDAENTQLNKALSGKDKVIEDLSKYKARIEADLNALMLRVESTEKENTSLKYEVRVLEKELDIRNEEREFNRRIADVAQKQKQESVKKMAKLESECQRLRVFVRKRLPGPAALARMKNEVEMLGKDQALTRRKSNSSSISSMDFHVDVAPDTPSREINFLTEQLQALEKENRSLKDAINNKYSELQFSMTKYGPTASRLSRIEGQVEEPLKGRTITEQGKYEGFLTENSVAASSDIGSDDKASCAESWASALISELELFKREKLLSTPSHRNMGTSDMNLMDDFAEMEKLAVVSLDYPAGSSHRSSEEGIAITSPSRSPSHGYLSPATCRDIGPIYDCPSEPMISSREIKRDSVIANSVPGQLGDILKMLLEHCQVSQRNPDEVLDDMKVALAQKSSDTYPNASNSNFPKVNRHVFQTSPNKTLKSDASDTRNGHDISSTKNSGQKSQSNMSISLHKILELLEGINLPSQDNGLAESFSGKDNKLSLYKDSGTPTSYTVRVFQWKTTELCAILQQFVQTCNDLLNGTAGLEQFSQQVASNLDWIMNHCFSLQDVSSMRDAIRSHLDWDESRSESELDSGSANYSAESNKLPIQREDITYIPMVSSRSGYNFSCQMEALQPNMKEEGKRLNIELVRKEPSTEDLEHRLRPEIIKGEYFRSQLQDSKDIENLQSEVGNVKHHKVKSGDQIEKRTMLKEDLETQIMENNLEQSKACQTISQSENELEKENQSHKRLDVACNDVKTQLKSMTTNEVPDHGEHWEKQLRNDWEITVASEKLAECQETILNLGKQLKALATPKDAALLDKVVSTPAHPVTTSMSTPRRNCQRSSLLDKMQAEDTDQMDGSSRTKDDIQIGNKYSSASTNTAMESWDKFTNPNENNHNGNKTPTVSTVIVPRKRIGARNFFKKLFWRGKKGNSGKLSSHKP